MSPFRVFQCFNFDLLSLEKLKLFESTLILDTWWYLEQDVYYL